MESKMLLSNFTPNHFALLKYTYNKKLIKKTVNKKTRFISQLWNFFTITGNKSCFITLKPSGKHRNQIFYYNNLFILGTDWQCNFLKLF